MKKTFNAIVIGLCLLGLCAIVSLVLGIFSPAPASPAVPTSIDVGELATRIATYLPTPGSGGSGGIATAVPYQVVLTLGDTEKIKAQLEGQRLESSVDWSAKTMFTGRGGYTYCEAAIHQDQGDDTRLTMQQRWQNNTIWIYPGGIYCAFGSAQGDLYAGILAPAINVTFSDGPVVTDDVAKQEVHTKDILIEVDATFGLVGPLIAPGNEKSIPILPEVVDDYSRAIVNTFSGPNGMTDERVSKVNNLSIDGARMDIVAPFDMLAGTRSSTNLDFIHDALERNFTQSGGQAPNAYDSTKALMCGLASAGVTADHQTSAPLVNNCTLVVNLVWPAESGTWYMLDSLGAPDPVPAVNKQDESLLRDNLYLVLSNQVKAYTGLNPRPWYSPYLNNWQITFTWVTPDAPTPWSP